MPGIEVLLDARDASALDGDDHARRHGDSATGWRRRAQHVLLHEPGVGPVMADLVVVTVGQVVHHPRQRRQVRVQTSRDPVGVDPDLDVGGVQGGDAGTPVASATPAGSDVHFGWRGPTKLASLWVGLIGIPIVFVAVALDWPNLWSIGLVGIAAGVLEALVPALRRSHVPGNAWWDELARQLP